MSDQATLLTYSMKAGSHCASQHHLTTSTLRSSHANSLQTVSHLACRIAGRPRHASTHHRHHSRQHHRSHRRQSRRRHHRSHLQASKQAGQQSKRRGVSTAARHNVAMPAA